MLIPIFAAVGLGWALLRAFTGGKGGTVDTAALERLNLGEAKNRIVRAMLAEWADGGVLTPDEQAALLAIAYCEGKFSLKAASPKGAPDDKGGGAFGTFQMLRTTLAELGVSPGDLMPVKGTDGKLSGAEIDRAARFSASVAVRHLQARKPRWAGGRTWLEGMRAAHPNDPEGFIRDLAVGWNAGPGRTWARDIAPIPPNPRPGSLGYVHYTVGRRLQAWNPMRAVLGLQPLNYSLTVAV